LTPSLPVSPNFPSPGPHSPLAELAEGDPLAALKYILQPRDPKHDYKDSHQARKRPSQSGRRSQDPS
jgi:hypothetical protein